MGSETRLDQVTLFYQVLRAGYFLFSEIKLDRAAERSVEVGVYADQPTQGEQTTKVNISLHECFISFYWHSQSFLWLAADRFSLVFGSAICRQRW